MTNLQKLGMVILIAELLALALIHGFISQLAVGCIVIVAVLIAAFEWSRDPDDLEF